MLTRTGSTFEKSESGDLRDLLIIYLNLAMYFSIDLSICLSVCLSVYLSIYLPIHMIIDCLIIQSTHLSIHPSTLLLVCPVSKNKYVLYAHNIYIACVPDEAFIFGRVRSPG